MPTNTAPRKQYHKPRQPDNAWDQINAMHINCATLVGGMANTIKNMMALVPWPELQPGDAEKITQMSNTIAADLQTFANRIEEIKSHHNGRSGSATNADDLMASFSVASAYDELNQRFMTLIAPAKDQFDQTVIAAVQNTDAVKAAELRQAAQTQPQAAQ